MKRIQVLFNDWMNSHSGNRQVNESYLQLQKKLPNVNFDPDMQKYLLQLEQQTFNGGFITGFRLAAECLVT